MTPKCKVCGKFYRPVPQARWRQKACRAVCKAKIRRMSLNAWSRLHKSRRWNYQRAYYDRNRERLLEENRERSKLHYKNNRTRILKRVSAYAAANRDKINKYAREYQARNKGRRRAYLLERRKINRPREREYRRRYNLLKKEFPGISKKEMTKLRQEAQISTSRRP